MIPATRARLLYKKNLPTRWMIAYGADQRTEPGAVALGQPQQSDLIWKV
jgi:hypothetical protein